MTLVLSAPAISTESQQVDRARQRWGVDRGSAFSLDARYQALRAALDEIARESDTVTEAALSEAARLLRTLPTSLPDPELASEDDGDVALEWIPSRTRMVTVSVGGRGRLAFAWLNGSDKGYGVARFNGADFPSVLADIIRSVLGGSSRVRTL